MSGELGPDGAAHGQVPGAAPGGVEPVGAAPGQSPRVAPGGVEPVGDAPGQSPRVMPGGVEAVGDAPGRSRRVVLGGVEAVGVAPSLRFAPGGVEPGGATPEQSPRVAPGGVVREGAAAAEGQPFPFRWLRVRRVRLAQVFSRLSVASLVAPVVLVYGVGATVEAFGVRLGLWRAARSLGVPQVVLDLARGVFTSVDTAIGLFLVGTAVSVALALVSVLVGAERRSAGGVLRAGPEGFTLEQEGGAAPESFARHRIAGGLLLEADGGSCVELHLADGRLLRIGMRSRNKARAMLDRLGMGPERRRIVAPQGRPNHVLAAGCAAYPAAFVLFATALLAFDSRLGALAPLFLALLVAGTTLLARRLARGAVVEIGAEGVSVRGAEPVGRFVRFEHIARVSRSGRMLLLMLRDDAAGEPRSPIRVACADADLAEGLGERIEEAMGRARGAHRQAPVAELLDPGDQPVAAWRAGLAGLLAVRAQYRSAGVVADDLLDVVEDPGAAPAARLGAAIALRTRRAPEDRERVRIAADTCADERLRAALEAAAAEEEMAEEVITRALPARRRA